MELGLADILTPAPSSLMLVEQAANDQPDAERIIAILTQQQEGINMLTSILAAQKQEIEMLKVEVRRLKARTDAPPRSSILRV